MDTLSSPRHRLAGLAFLLALGVGLIMTVPALADYLGPDRTVSVWAWERLRCHYEAVYDPSGVGWFGCTLDLNDTPDASCPLTGSVTALFNPTGCPGWPGSCTTLPCSISLSASVGGCSEGETGCTAVERTTTLPEATVSGWVSCGVPGAGGWCLADADLSLTGSEPLAGYSILTLEGTRNIIPGGGGETFACLGALCDVPLVEGTNDFAFWAISSWGDTSLLGTTSGGLDSRPPVISGEISGATGNNGWYLSDVAFSASASDPSPGSGLLRFELSLDGGGWTAYTGPLTFSDGSHTVELRAGDTAGNTNTQSPTVRVDTQPPGLDLIANDFFCPVCGEQLDVAVDVQDGGSGVVEWMLTADAGLVASGSGATSQVLPWDGSGLPGGPYTLSLRARDAAGNTSESSLAVSLLVPTPAPPPAELPRAETLPGSGPTWSTAVRLATPTVVPTATRPSRPTRTPEVIPFGGVPAVPLANEGEEPRSNPPAEILGSPQPSVPGSSSGVLWGGAALALIAAATAIALDQARRRREEEARQREEMERRNAAQRAREAAERARIAAAAAARAQQMQVSPDYGAIVGAALGAAGAEERIRAAQDRRVERREEEMEAEAETRRLAAATAQLERLREIAEGRDEGPDSLADDTQTTQSPPAAPDGSTARRIFGGARAAEGAFEASALRFGDLEGGYVSVSGSPDFPQASRVEVRRSWDLRGTRYRPDTIAGRVRGGLLGRAVSRSSLLFAVGTALLGNLIDYGFGEHRDTGVISWDFAVSTTVDFGLSLLTGVVAAALVGGAIALVGVSLPLWAALGATAILGVGIGLGLEAIGVGGAVEQGLLSWISGLTSGE
jgi:hypothetical protein